MDKPCSLSSQPSKCESNDKDNENQCMHTNGKGGRTNITLPEYHRKRHACGMGSPRHHVVTGREVCRDTK